MDFDWSHLHSTDFLPPSHHHNDDDGHHRHHHHHHRLVSPMGSPYHHHQGYDDDDDGISVYSHPLVPPPTPAAPTPTPNTPYLFHLLRNSDWAEAERRLVTHPHEAKFVSGHGRNALHEAFDGSNFDGLAAGEEDEERGSSESGGYDHSSGSSPPPPPPPSLVRALIAAGGTRMIAQREGTTSDGNGLGGGRSTPLHLAVGRDVDCLALGGAGGGGGEEGVDHGHRTNDSIHELLLLAARSAGLGQRGDKGDTKHGRGESCSASLAHFVDPTTVKDTEGRTPLDVFFGTVWTETFESTSSSSSLRGRRGKDEELCRTACTPADLTGSIRALWDRAEMLLTVPGGVGLVDDSSDDGMLRRQRRGQRRRALPSDGTNGSGGGGGGAGGDAGGDETSTGGTAATGTTTLLHRIASAQTQLPPSYVHLAVRLCVNQGYDTDVNGRVPLSLAVLNCHRTLGNKTQQRQSKSSTIPPLIQSLTELCPESSSIPDAVTGRLPLHHALGSSSSRRRLTWSAGIRAILDDSPRALSTRDSVTHLYPFMMAAVVAAKIDGDDDDAKEEDRSDRDRDRGGDRSESDELLEDLTTVFELLRADPSLAYGLAKIPWWVRLNEAEDEVTRLELRNESLMDEVKREKEEKARLQVENDRLVEMLGRLSSTTTTTTTAGTGGGDVVVSVGVGVGGTDAASSFVASVTTTACESGDGGGRCPADGFAAGGGIGKRRKKASVGTPTY